MNYIKLINNFWKADRQQQFTGNETRLYFFLVDSCNLLGWKNPFKHSDRHLSFAIGVSNNTIRKVAVSLKNRGFIDFKTPEKRSRGINGQTTYFLIENPFSSTSKNKKTDAPSASVTASVIASVDASVTASVENKTDAPSASVTASVTASNNKLETINKNKDIDKQKSDFAYLPKSVENSLPLNEKKEQKNLGKKVTRPKSEVKKNTPPVAPAPPSLPKAQKKFIKPTVAQIAAYCTQRSNKVDPQKFHDHYTSNGWRIGKNPMVCWQAAIRTWEKNEFNLKNNLHGSNKPNNKPNNQPIAEGKKDYTWGDWKPGQGKV